MTFLSVVPCAGIRTRSDQSVTSDAIPAVVHASPESRKVVRSCGSQRGSQRCLPGLDAALRAVEPHPVHIPAVGIRLGYEDQPRAPSFCAVYHVAVRFCGAASRISGRGSRSRTGD